MRPPNYYHKIIINLNKLKDVYPSYNMGRHLSTIIDECGDVWGMTDKELFNSLNRYMKQLALDIPHEEKELDKIIQEGMHLDKILIDDNYQDDF
jgi:hypothetical protein